MLESLTESANKVVMDAQKEAKFLGHKYISTEHILLGILGDATGLVTQVLNSFGIDLDVCREQTKKLIGIGGGCEGSASKDLRFTYDVKCVFDFSLKLAKMQGHDHVETVDLFYGLLHNGAVNKLIENQGADVIKIRAEVLGRHTGDQIEENVHHGAMPAESSENKMGGQAKENVQSDAESSKNQKMKASFVYQNNGINANKDDKKITALEIYGTNLTKLAQEGKLLPFVGREEQVERVIQIICRRMKNNPCLVGEPSGGAS